MNNKLQEITDYRNFDALSQSFLKSSVINESTKEFKGSVATMLGNLTDTILTIPECVDDLYYISKVKKYPKPQIKEVWDLYYKNLIDNNLDLEIDNLPLLEIYREVSDLKSNDEKMLFNLMEGEYYFKDLVASTGKSVISLEYYEKCSLVAYSMKTNGTTYTYFQERDGVEIQYQVPLYFKYVDPMDGWSYNCKGLLDEIIIDHNEKTIQIIDIKTTSDYLDSWVKNIAKKHRPDLQLAFYTYGLKEWAKEHYHDYTVINPCLIVENVDYPGRPRVFNLTDQDMHIGRYGCQRSKHVIKPNTDNLQLIQVWDDIFGWQKAIEKYHQCQELSLPDFCLNYHTTKGVTDLNLWF